MNLGQLSEYVQKRILKKWDTDPEIIRTVINEALMEMQRGVIIDGAMIQRDWSAMQYHYIRDYKSGGIQLDDSVTRVRMVYKTYTNADGNVLRAKPLTPSSEDAQDNRRDGHHMFHYQTDDQINSGKKHGEHNVWWIEERKIMLGRHLHECNEEIKLWVEVYRILPALINPTDTNWFTEHAWDAVAWKAAAIGFSDTPDRFQVYETVANARIKSLINADERYDAAGTADVVRPARPNPFRREYYEIGA